MIDRKFLLRPSPLFALLVIAVVYFYRLDQPLLWGDEADTGIESRNILTRGYPIAYDGRNVCVIENGMQLNRDLVCSRAPWIQYYLGALSLFLFGNDTFGLRVLFATCGVLTFIPLYDFLRTRFKFPALTTALILLSPQIVLFQRNARYYPLLTLVYAILVWHLAHHFKSARARMISAAIIFILFFHIHSFAAACSAIGIVTYSAIQRRDLLLPYLGASAVGFGTWLLWNLFLGPAFTHDTNILPLIFSQFDQWLSLFLTGLWASVVDVDAIDCCPLLLCVVLIVYLLIRRRSEIGHLFREAPFAFILINFAIQIIASAALFGSESNAHYSLLRYEPHLLVFSLVFIFAMLNAAIPSKSPYLVMGIITIACNFFTFSYWSAPLSRIVPVTWITPVYSEILNPPIRPWCEVVERLQREAPLGSPIVAAFLPSWTQAVALFYLGNRYLVQPLMVDDDGQREKQLRLVLGNQATDQLFARPSWIIDMDSSLPSPPIGYIFAGAISSIVAAPAMAAGPS